MGGPGRTGPTTGWVPSTGAPARRKGHPALQPVPFGPYTTVPPWTPRRTGQGPGDVRPFTGPSSLGDTSQSGASLSRPLPSRDRPGVGPSGKDLPSGPPFATKVILPHRGRPVYGVWAPPLESLEEPGLLTTPLDKCRFTRHYRKTPVIRVRRISRAPRWPDLRVYKGGPGSSYPSPNPDPPGGSRDSLGLTGHP